MPAVLHWSKLGCARTGKFYSVLGKKYDIRYAVGYNNSTSIAIHVKRVTPRLRARGHALNSSLYRARGTDRPSRRRERVRRPRANGTFSRLASARPRPGPRDKEVWPIWSVCVLATYAPTSTATGLEAEKDINEGKYCCYLVQDSPSIQANLSECSRAARAGIFTGKF